MRQPTRFLSATAALTALGALAGCGLQGPTYGTGTPSNVQLMEDVTNIASFGGRRGEPIAYNPRPELVEPPAGSVASLPQPQADVRGGEAWPESPEERSARYRDYATQNRDETGFSPAVTSGDDAAGSRARSRFYDDNTTIDMRANNNDVDAARLRRQAMQGDPNQRRYLSEPPTTYRSPADTAPVGELGEDEEDKQARLEREAKGGGRDWWPF